MPSLPKNICWDGLFTGESVGPLLPEGKNARLLMPADPTFDVFEKRSSTYCKIFVTSDLRESFLAWAERRSSGKGTGWNHWGPSTTRIAAGDEGFVWDTGASAVILCERPDLGGKPGRFKDQKYVELALIAKDAANTARTRESLTTLIKQYADFAKRELKCANGA
ncbi:hypothetical protein ACFWXK_20385 [Streptomyces sp. NPDC059070]|uniref:hypothetical protein n=1 Tax=Streptomyces sp. NPDC059070 TaxID=3346713 RepID=UPI00368ED12C